MTITSINNIDDFSNYINNKYTNSKLFWDINFFKDYDSNNNIIERQYIIIYLRPKIKQIDNSNNFGAKITIKNLTDFKIEEDYFEPSSGNIISNNFGVFFGILEKMSVRNNNKLQFWRRGYVRPRLYFEIEISSNNYLYHIHIKDKIYYEYYGKIKNYEIEKIDKNNSDIMLSYPYLHSNIINVSMDDSYLYILKENIMYYDIETAMIYPILHSPIKVYEKKYQTDKIIDKANMYIKNIKL